MGKNLWASLAGKCGRVVSRSQAISRRMAWVRHGGRSEIRVRAVHGACDGLGSLVWGPRVGGIRIDTTRRVLWTRKILGALSEARVGAHRGLLSPGRLPLVSPSSCWSAPERSACFERPVSRSRRSPVGRVSRAQLYLRHARQGLPRSSQVILTPHVCLLRGRASSLVVTA